MSSDGKTILADIAAVHEFGSQSGNIPARPLWQPSYKEAVEWHEKNNDPRDIFMKKLRRLV